MQHILAQIFSWNSEAGINHCFIVGQTLAGVTLTGPSVICSHSDCFFCCVVHYRLLQIGLSVIGVSTILNKAQLWPQISQLSK